jgi:MFS family permease
LASLQVLTPRAFRGRVNALFVSGVTLIAFGLGPFLVGVLNDRIFGAEGVGLAMLTVFVPVSALGSVLALVGGAVRTPSRPDRSR